MDWLFEAKKRFNLSVLNYMLWRSDKLNPLRSDKLNRLFTALPDIIFKLFPAPPCKKKIKYPAAPAANSMHFRAG